MDKQDKVEEPSTVAEFKRRIKSHCKLLYSCMEYEYGLNDILQRAPAMLSDKEYSKLNVPTLSAFKQNELLVEMLCQRETVEEYLDFMNALAQSYQSHLKALIFRDNKFTKEETDRPLEFTQRQQLKHNRESLVPILAKEVTELLEAMYAKKCVSDDHIDVVRGKQPSRKQARGLLDIVQNRSLNHFQIFRECLAKIKSTALQLTDLTAAEDETSKEDKIQAGVLTVNAETSTDSVSRSKLSEFEDTVSIRFEASSSSSPKKNWKNWILDYVVYMYRSNSIRIYIGYHNLNVLANLRQAALTDDMQKAIQLLCDSLLSELPAGTLKIGLVTMVDFSTQEFLQKCIDEKADPSDHMSNHPLLRNGEKNMKEVFTHTAYKKARRKLLVFSYMWRIENDRKLSSRPDLEAFETLAHVCHDWCETSRDKEFKQTVKALRKQSRKKNRSLKLRCEIMIPMPNATCATSIDDDIYLTTEFEVNTMYLLKQIPQVQQESGRPRRIRLQHIELQELERIQIADNLDVLGMEAAEDGTGIFCINRPDGSIWFWTRSEARNPATVLQQFSASSCVTVCPEDGLRIVVLRDSNVLEMHNQPSELIQVMDLPDYITKPNAVACNNDGDVIVSYGSDADELHRISMVDRRGRVVLTYGDKKGSDPNQLNNPSSITLDHDEDILYVVDKNNGRILALDKNLDLINVVLDCKYDDLRNITSVHYAKLTKQLVVVHQDMVNLYKIHRPGVQEVAK